MAEKLANTHGFSKQYWQLLMQDAAKGDSEAYKVVYDAILSVDDSMADLTDIEFKAWVEQRPLSVQEDIYLADTEAKTDEQLREEERQRQIEQAQGKAAPEPPDSDMPKVTLDWDQGTVTIDEPASERPPAEATVVDVKLDWEKGEVIIGKPQKMPVLTDADFELLTDANSKKARLTPEGVDARSIEFTIPDDAIDVIEETERMVATGSDQDMFMVQANGTRVFRSSSAIVNRGLAVSDIYISDLLLAAEGFKKPPFEDPQSFIAWYRDNVAGATGDRDDIDYWSGGIEEGDKELLFRLTNDLTNDIIGNAIAAWSVLKERAPQAADHVEQLLRDADQGDPDANYELQRIIHENSVEGQVARTLLTALTLGETAKTMNETYFGDIIEEREQREMLRYETESKNMLGRSVPSLITERLVLMNHMFIPSSARLMWGVPVVRENITKPVIRGGMRGISEILGFALGLTEWAHKKLTGRPDSSYTGISAARVWASRTLDPDRYAPLIRPASTSREIVERVARVGEFEVGLNSQGQPTGVYDRYGNALNPIEAQGIIDTYNKNKDTIPTETVVNYSSVMPTVAEELTRLGIQMAATRGVAKGLRPVAPAAMLDRLSIAGATYAMTYSSYYEQALGELGLHNAREAARYARWAALIEAAVETINPIEAAFVGKGPRDVAKAMRRRRGIHQFQGMFTPQGMIKNTMRVVGSALKHGSLEGLEGLLSQGGDTLLRNYINDKEQFDDLRKLSVEDSMEAFMNAFVTEMLPGLIMGGATSKSPAQEHLEALMYADQNRDKVLAWMDEHGYKDEAKYLRDVLKRADEIRVRRRKGTPAAMREAVAEQGEPKRGRPKGEGAPAEGQPQGEGTAAAGTTGQGQPQGEGAAAQGQQGQGAAAQQQGGQGEGAAPRLSPPKLEEGKRDKLSPPKLEGEVETAPRPNYDNPDEARQAAEDLMQAHFETALGYSAEEAMALIEEAKARHAEEGERKKPSIGVLEGRRGKLLLAEETGVSVPMPDGTTMTLAEVRVNEDGSKVYVMEDDAGQQFTFDRKGFETLVNQAVDDAIMRHHGMEGMKMSAAYRHAVSRVIRAMQQAKIKDLEQQSEEAPEGPPAYRLSEVAAHGDELVEVSEQSEDEDLRNAATAIHSVFPGVEIYVHDDLAAFAEANGMTLPEGARALTIGDAIVLQSDFTLEDLFHEAADVIMQAWLATPEGRAVVDEIYQQAAKDESFDHKAIEDRYHKVLGDVDEHTIKKEVAAEYIAQDAARRKATERSLSLPQRFMRRVRKALGFKGRGSDHAVKRMIVDALVNGRTLVAPVVTHTEVVDPQAQEEAVRKATEGLPDMHEHWLTTDEGQAFVDAVYEKARQDSSFNWEEAERVARQQHPDASDADIRRVVLGDYLSRLDDKARKKMVKGIPIPRKAAREIGRFLGIKGRGAETNVKKALLDVMAKGYTPVGKPQESTTDVQEYEEPVTRIHGEPIPGTGGPAGGQGGGGGGSTTTTRTPPQHNLPPQKGKRPTLFSLRNAMAFWHRRRHLREGTGTHDHSNSIAGDVPTNNPVTQEMQQQMADFKAHVEDIIRTIWPQASFELRTVRRPDRPGFVETMVLLHVPGGTVAQTELEALSVLLTTTAPRWHGGVSVHLQTNNSTTATAEVRQWDMTYVVGPNKANIISDKDVKAITEKVVRSLHRLFQRHSGDVPRIMGVRIDNGRVLVEMVGDANVLDAMEADMRFFDGQAPVTTSKTPISAEAYSRLIPQSDALKGHDDALDIMLDNSRTTASRVINPEQAVMDDPFLPNSIASGLLVQRLVDDGMPKDVAVDVVHTLTNLPRHVVEAMFEHAKQVMEFRSAIGGALARLPWIGDMIRKWFRYRGRLPEEMRMLDILRNGSKEYMMRRARRVADKLDEMMAKVPESQRPMMRELAGRYLEGEQRREMVALIPDDMRQQLDEARAILDHMSMTMVSQNLVTNPAVRDNIGRHVSRIFGVHAIPEKGVLGTLFDKATGRITKDAFDFDKLDKQLRDRAIDELMALRGGHYSKDYDPNIHGQLHDYLRKRAEQELRSMLADYQKEATAPPVLPTDSASRDVSLLRRRKDLPPAIREVLGEVNDVAARFFYTSMRMADLTYTSMFLSHVAAIGEGKVFFPADYVDRPKGYDTLIAESGNQAWRPLAGWYTSKEIVDDLKAQRSFVRSLGIVDPVWGWMRRAAAAINWNNTVGSIPTQARNIAGNVEFVFNMGWLNPAEGAKVIGWLRGNIGHELFEAAQQMGLVDENVTLRTLQDLIRDASVEELFHAYIQSKKASKKKMMAWARTKGEDAVGWLNALYRNGDDFFKLLGFAIEANRYAKALYGKGYGHLDAGQKAVVNNYANTVVRAILPNYSAIGRVQRWLSVTPIVGQFTTFRFEAIRTYYNYWSLIATEYRRGGAFRNLAIRRLISGLAWRSIKFAFNVAMAAKLGTVVMGWHRSLASVITGGDGGEEDERIIVEAARRMLPPWAENRTMVPIHRDGYRVIYIDLNSVDPHSLPEELINFVMDRDVTKNPGELLRIVLQDFISPTILTEELGQFFYGEKGDFVFIPDGDPVKNAGRLLKYVGKQLQGTYRFFSSKIEKSETMDEATKKILLGMGGVTTYTVDPVVFVRRRIAEDLNYKEGAIPDLQFNIRRKVRRARSAGAPESDVQAIITEAKGAMMKKLDRLAEDIYYAMEYAEHLPEDVRGEAIGAIRKELSRMHSSEYKYVMSRISQIERVGIDKYQEQQAPPYMFNVR
ncbi:MAG: hypothetical protein D6746_05090 [Bacteroidetes bacterium]|nr:MAG: hypothetical protein D6746_05090 [Bacteroidota bacterium]